MSYNAPANEGHTSLACVRHQTSIAWNIELHSCTLQTRHSCDEGDVDSYKGDVLSFYYASVFMMRMTASTMIAIASPNIDKAKVSASIHIRSTLL